MKQLLIKDHIFVAGGEHTCTCVIGQEEFVWEDSYGFIGDCHAIC